MTIIAGSRYHFLFGTSTEYTALQTAGKIDENDLYFVTDNKQLYVGNDLYTGQVTFVIDFPENPSQGIIYVNGTTHETKVWDGTKWNVMVPPIVDTITTATADTDLASVKAIKDYLTEQINDVVIDITYAEDAQKFVVTYGNLDTTELLLKNLIIGAVYDGTTGNFTFTTANGDPIVVNTPVENFLSSASFNVDTKVLTLTLTNGTTFDVNLADLVDTYTVKSTTTVELAMSVTGEITANVKKSATTGNALVLNKDGLFVPEALVKSLSNTNTVTLTETAGALSADVKVSAEAGNTLVVKDDGLYTDMSNYYKKAEIDEFTTWKTIIE